MSKTASKTAGKTASKTAGKTAGQTRSRSEQLLGVAMFAQRPSVGGRQLYPITGGRAAILEERNNALAVGVEGDGDVCPWTLYEVMMVASLEKSDLSALSLEKEREWKLAVREFALDVADADLNEFWVIVQAELEAIERAKAVPAKKTTGRRVRR